MVLTKKTVFAVQKQCINLINPILFPHVQFVNYVVQRKNVEMTIIANIHSSPSSPPVETQVLSVAQGRLHCCVRRLACLEQLTQVPGSPLNVLGSNNPTPSYTTLVILV